MAKPGRLGRSMNLLWMLWSMQFIAGYRAGRCREQWQSESWQTGKERIEQPRFLGGGENFGRRGGGPVSQDESGSRGAARQADGSSYAAQIYCYNGKGYLLRFRPGPSIPASQPQARWRVHQGEVRSSFLRSELGCQRLRHYFLDH